MIIELSDSYFFYYFLFFNFTTNFPTISAENSYITTLLFFPIREDIALLSHCLINQVI